MDFPCVSFCPVDFPCVSFCPVDFPCISFCPVNFDCVSFCPVDFPLISFDNPPTVSVDWGTIPTLSCVVTVACSQTQGLMLGENEGVGSGNEVPITVGDLGIPSKIEIVFPKVPPIRLEHDIPSELFLRVPDEIRLIGPKNPIPSEIFINENLPRSIEIIHSLPDRLMIDASNMPTRILVEPAPNFPSILRLEVFGMPQVLQVVGIPQTISIIESIPRTIQLVMPENPVVRMEWNGGPLELKPSPDLEKLLTNLVIPPK